jgi:hypothetical protein
MGWTHYADHPQLSRAEMIRREFTQEPTATNPRAWGFESIAERGSVVYAVCFQEFEGKREHFGCVFLTTRRKGEFGYKAMSEDMHPFYYAMPARMLAQLEALAPNPPGQGAEWRAKCREHAKPKPAPRLVGGQLVTYGGRQYRLDYPAGPRRGWIVIRVSDGQPFRLNARQLSRAEGLV